MRHSTVVLVVGLLAAAIPGIAQTIPPGTTVVGQVATTPPANTPAPVPSVSPLQQRAPGSAGLVPEQVAPPPPPPPGASTGASPAGPANSTPFSAGPSGVLPSNPNSTGNRTPIPGSTPGGTPNLSR